MFTGGISRRVQSSKSRRYRDQALFAAIESLESRRLLSAGTLDTTFNGTGLVVNNLTGAESAGVSAMVEQSDGKFVVGADNAGGFALARYNGNGSLDTSFGSGGTVQTGLPGSVQVALGGLAIVPDTGDIVAVGNDNGLVAVAEYLPNGNLDPAFNSGSPLTFNFDPGDTVNMNLVAVDSNDNIVVGGTDTSAGGETFAVARITPAGSLDTTFNGDGEQTVSFGAGDYASPKAIALTPTTNQIVLVGQNNNGGSLSIAAAWLKSDGSLNTAFGGGTETYEFANNPNSTGTAVAIDGGDGLVIAGTDYNASGYGVFGVIRVNPDGTSDSTFNAGAGYSDIDFGSSSYAAPTAVAIESSGQIVVGGEVTFPGQQAEFAVAVLNGDGTSPMSAYLQPAGGAYVAGSVSMALDSSGDVLLAATGESSSFPSGINTEFAFAEFNNGLAPDGALNGSGTETTPFSGTVPTEDVASAVQSDGKILVAGATTYGNEVYITRYDSNGSLDSTFGNDGTIIVGAPNSVPTNYFIPASLAVGSDGTIYLAGDDVTDSRAVGVQIFSYQTNGAANDTFNGTGNVSISFAGDNYTRVGGIAVDGDGNVVVDGAQGIVIPGDEGTMFVERLTPAGGADDTFNGTGTELINFAGSTISLARSLALSNDGQIVVAGEVDFGNLGPSSSIALAVAVLNANGTPSGAFNGGQAMLDLGPGTDVDDEGVAVTSLPDGDVNDVVLSGYDLTSLDRNPNFILTAFNSTGELDPSFGDPSTPGYDTSFFGGQESEGYDVAIDQTGNIVVVGDQTDNSGNENSLLADFNPDGTLNTNFAGGGVVISNPGGISPSLGFTVDIDPYNRIVVVNDVTIPGPGEEGVVARYSNGPLSTSVTVSAPSVVYGNSATLTASVVSGSPVDSGNVTFTVTNASDVVVATLTSPVSSGSAAASQALAAGTYSVSAAYADTGETFEASSSSTTLVVQAAPLTIAVNDVTVPYGTPVASFGVTYTGFVNNDGPSDLTGSLSFSTSATVASPVGEYGVTVSGVSSSNYAITFAPGTLTIIQAPLTINVVNSTAVYGAALPTFSVSYSGFENSDGPSSLNGTLSFTTSATQGSPVGSYDVSASGLTATNYAITFVDGTLNITPASLTVSVNNSMAVYGSGLPAFSVSYSSFVGSDSPASLGGSLAFSTTALAQPGVGSYVISATGLTSNNYLISYQTGTLSITAAPLTVSVNNATRNFGVANPTFTGTITGLQYSDSVSVSYSTTATPTSPAANYAINASVTGAALANYNLTVIPGTLTVTPVGLNLTVTVNNATRTYGAANPTFSGTVSGAVGGDTFTVTYSTTATPTSGVGSYAINATVTGADLANYNLIVTPGTLVITKAALSVAANPASKVYGQANPSLTGTITGIENGDNITATYTTTATTSSGVGSYTITPVVSGSPSVLANYNLTVSTSTLTVTKAALTITAVNQTKTYGSANPALTVSYSGFVNGDTSSVLTHAPVVSTTATTSSNVGGYAITVSGATAANYAITFVSGTLNVTKATLYVIVNSTIKFVGQPDPSFRTTDVGFVLSQNGSVLGGTLVFTTAATKNSPIGIYVVTATGLTSGNYNIVYIPGILLEL